MSESSRIISLQQRLNLDRTSGLGGSSLTPREGFPIEKRDLKSNRSIPEPNSPLLNSFNKTNLDLENPEVLGGPNRTGPSIPGGTYTVQAGNSQNPLSNGGVPLTNDEGIEVTKQVHAYTPTNTYLQQMNEIIDID